MNASQGVAQRTEHGMDGKSVTACPKCGARYRVSGKHAGSPVTCRMCGVEFTILFDPALEGGENGAEVQDIGTDDPLLVLGKLAVKFEMATQEQVDAALAAKAEREAAGEHVSLGDLLVARDVIDPNQLGFLLSVQRMRETQAADRRFGLIAEKNRFCTPADIEEALKVQKEAFLKHREILRIGEILVDHGALSRQQCDAILYRQRALGEVDDGVEAGAALPAVRVSPDRMRAELVAPGPLPPDFSVGDVRRMLAGLSVVHGILDEKTLAGLLKQGLEPGRPVVVAEGDAPQAETATRLTWHFDTDPLRFGVYSRGGVVDFSSPGLPDSVEAGALLAEIREGHAAKDGMDVHGKPVPAARAKAGNPAETPAVLTAGPGVRIEDGGKKAFAEHAGRPEFCRDGSLAVRHEMVIGGDVGADTGDLVYDGCVVVEGTVRTGFKVRAGRLVCQGIGSAQVEVDGDVVVAGGIQGADVKAGGSLRARTVRSATVRAMGGVMVEQEIRDSQVESAGTCVLGTGKIVASEVFARQGVEVGQVGAAGTKPCTLVVGTDKRVKNETAALANQVAEKKKRIRTLENVLAERGRQAAKVRKQIGQLSDVQDKAVREKQNVEEDLAAGPAEAARERLERRLWDLGQHVEETNKVLAGLYNEQDELVAKSRDTERDTARLREDVERLKERIAALKEWSATRPREAVIRAYGVVHPQTTLIGPHASLVLQEGVSRVTVREAPVVEKGGKKAWAMQVARMK